MKISKLFQGKHGKKLTVAAAATVGLALCLLCAAAAFFLPNAQGMVLSYLAIALGTVVTVLCVAGLMALMRHPNAA